MANRCKHIHTEAFINQNPSKEEIKKFRLYFCDDCRQWFSFLL